MLLTFTYTFLHIWIFSPTHYVILSRHPIRGRVGINQSELSIHSYLKIKFQFILLLFLVLFSCSSTVQIFLFNSCTTLTKKNSEWILLLLNTLILETVTPDLGDFLLSQLIGTDHLLPIPSFNYTREMLLDNLLF